MGINDIRRDHPDLLGRMMNDEALLRIGPIWYGVNTSTTVANIYYVTNKKVNLIPTLRTETAMSFASTNPPIDTMQVELVINYQFFRENVQKLFALAQLMPVVPVHNLVIAAVTQPIEHNRRIYSAYGYNMAHEVDVHSLREPNPTDTPKEQDKKRRMYSMIKEMYCAVPIQMKIDNIRIETITGIPRDIRVLVRLTRTLTVNSYGDRVEYLTDMNSVVNQADFLGEIGRKQGSIAQMQAVTDMLGVETQSLRDMIDTLQSSDLTENTEYLTGYIVHRVVSADHIKVMKKGNSKVIDVVIAGVEAPLYNKTIGNRTYSQPYGQQAYEKVKALLKKNSVVKLKYIAKPSDTPRGSDYRVCHVYVESKDDLSKPTNINLGRYLLHEGLSFVSEQYIDSDTIRIYNNDVTTAKTMVPVKGIWKEKDPESPSQFIRRLKEGRKQ